MIQTQYVWHRGMKSKSGRFCMFCTCSKDLTLASWIIKEHLEMTVFWEFVTEFLFLPHLETLEAIDIKAEH